MENTVVENLQNTEIMESMEVPAPPDHALDVEQPPLLEGPAFPKHPAAGNARPPRAASGPRRRAVPATWIFSNPPEILRGLREIAAFLHISHAEVLELENEGAPIVRRKNILRAEKSELWEWFKRNS